ncbi:glycosyl hydrolase, partial [bacterium]|nr:glycosyl hydrolase [bacterium]
IIAGAWIGTDREANEREIAALIEVARAGHVDIAAVGNEVLLRGDLSTDQLIDYVRRVKAALPDLPVGCVDAYFQFDESPELVRACDVILANCYPFWEGCDVAEASTRLQQMHASVVKVAGGKPVIVTETGWPSDGSPVRQAMPSPVNVMKYFIDLNKWSQKHGVDVFYFSSFDESWKVRHEGDVGQRWGLWDTSEVNKYL